MAPCSVVITDEPPYEVHPTGDGGQAKHDSSLNDETGAALMTVVYQSITELLQNMKLSAERS